MTLHMQQSVFSDAVRGARKRFSIKDERGNDRYSVTGALLPFFMGQHFSIYGTSGHVVATVKEKIKLGTFIEGLEASRYSIAVNGRGVCDIIVTSKKWLRRSIDFSGLPWRLKGGWGGIGSEVKNGDLTVMRLQWQAASRPGATYELAIADPQHDLVCLCIALVIDNIYDTH